MTGQVQSLTRGLNLLEHSPTQYVGLQAFTVGAGFLANRDFVAQSHVHMRRLMEQSGETANLAILDGTEAVFIAQVQCHEMMRTLVSHPADVAPG